MTRGLIFGLLAVSWLSYALGKYVLDWLCSIFFTGLGIVLKSYSMDLLISYIRRSLNLILQLLFQFLYSAHHLCSY